MKFFLLINGLADFDGSLKTKLIFNFILFFFVFSVWNLTQAQNSVVVNGGQNNVQIKEVTVTVDKDGPNQQTIVQTIQGLPNPIPEDGMVEIESILF
jgi:hypothetical protein